MRRRNRLRSALSLWVLAAVLSLPALAAGGKTDPVTGEQVDNKPKESAPAAKPAEEKKPEEKKPEEKKPAEK